MPGSKPSPDAIASRARRGRAAQSNAAGRFEPCAREAVDDGWDPGDGPPPLKRFVTIEKPRTIVNYVESPFVGFDRSINPYRRCEHGCIYCFARPTHAFHGLSPGLDFEQRLFAKPDAAKLLERELRAPSYSPRHIAIGTNTDPYQPIERRYRIMRGVLKTLHAFRHPVSILTKSALIARDIDLIAPMAADGLAKAMLSITTLDPRLARAMEPRASTPKRRLEAVKRLSEAGVPVGVMTAPMIPGLNDSELEALLEAARAAGATYAGYTIVRLPMEVAGLFREWLEAAFPDRAARVMRLIREMNGGKDYDPEWTRSATPRGSFATLLSQRFAIAARRTGLSTAMPTLDAASFRRPAQPGDQLSLFAESKPDQL